VTLTPARTALALLGALLVIAAVDAGALFHREQLRRRIAAYATERMPGADLEIGRVSLRPLSWVRIADLRVRPREAGAPATATSTALGEVTIRSLTIEHSPTALLTGRYAPLRVSAEEVAVSTRAPGALLASLRAIAAEEWGDLARLGEGAGPDEKEQAPVRIARLRLRREGGVIPFARPLSVTAGVATEGEILLERVELRPARVIALPPDPDGARDGAAPRRPRRYLVSATARLERFESIDVAGEIDLDAALFRCEVRATNLNLRGRHVEALGPEVTRWFDALDPQGPVDLALSISAPWERPADATVAGTAESFSVTLRPKGFGRPITNVSGRARFAGRRLVIEALRGVLGAGEVHAHGAVEDARAGTGVTLEVEGTGLDLPDLAALPVPPPYGAALAALALEGKSDLRVSLISDPQETLDRARFRIDAGLDGASALGGAVGGITGRVVLSGTRASGRAQGTLRLDRAQVLEAPIRGATGRISIDETAVMLEECEGRLAEGAVTGGGGIIFGAGGSRTHPPGSAFLDLSASDVALTPFARRAYERPIDLPGRASGTVSLRRSSVDAGLHARAVLALAGADLRALPLAAPLLEGGMLLGPAPRGALEFTRRADGSGEALLTLAVEGPAGPPREESAALAFDAAGVLGGHARGPDLALTIVGSLSAPRIATGTATPGGK